ncbi:hypothetical protein ABW19_dt0203153 [Dactylella cylindrospora]|nr:hypothetical protein ABW19_dt0203153 [Dactylella cylindrospora]
MRGIISSSTSCQSAVTRLPIRIAQWIPYSPTSRSISTKSQQLSRSVTQQLSRVRTTTPLTPYPLQKSPISWIRLLATGRRNAPKRVPPKPATGSSSKPHSPENTDVKPTFADPKSGALSTESGRMAVGSKEWYEYYRQRATLSDKLVPDEMSAVSSTISPLRLNYPSSRNADD